VSADRISGRLISRVIDQPQDVRFRNEDMAIVISEGGYHYSAAN